jgi:tripartite-type tricarboxylate transporter receptor subunit TctC
MKSLALALVFVSVAFAVPEQSAAQNYPSKPIRLVVGFAQGGGPDVLARIIAQKFGERLGQQGIVENKPGADGIIGVQFAAKASPDGYTLLVGGTSEMVLNTRLHENLPYDPVKDFAPITTIYSSPMVFAVHPSVPAATVAELIALVKARPKGEFFAVGAPVFLVAAELFKKQAGVNLTEVSFKGSSPAVAAVIAGQVPLVITSMPSSMNAVKSGRLRALAVTSAKRDSLMPDVPTMMESGLPNYEFEPWVGLYAPVGTPGAIIDRLNADVRAILGSDEIKARAASLGVNLGASSPEIHGAMLKSDIARVATITIRKE